MSESHRGYQRRGRRRTAPALRDRVFVPPRPRAPILSEQPYVPERLRELLEKKLGTGILHVQAPAGCGKTATILRFLLDQGVEPSWYACTADDADPAHLLVGLVRAMDGDASMGGQTSLAALMSVDVKESYRAALRPFLEGLNVAAPSGFLVVDDADELLKSSGALQALDYLISSCSPAIKIVLISRAELPLGSQAKRLLEGGAARVIAEDLLFRPDEIAGFARTTLSIELSANEVQRLYRATGGWAIALRLALRLRDLGATVGSDEHASFTPEARADLFAYLATEVLSRADDRVAGFLRQTAVLETLDVPVCARLATEEKPAELLQGMARAGLPVIKAGWNSYRCHSLLREYFLARMSNAELRDAHVAAGRAYTDVADYTNALVHLIAARDTSGALALADAHGRELFHAGRGSTLADLAKAASPGERSAHYRALYWAAVAASRTFDREWATTALIEVRALADARGDHETARDALGSLAYTLNVAGRFAPAAAAAKELIASIPADQRASRAAAALSHLVPGMTGSDHFKEAVDLIREELPWLTSEPRADVDVETFARAVAAVTLARDGDFAAAHAQLNLADLLTRVCRDDIVRTQVPSTRAMVGFLGGDLHRAEAASREAETLALQVGDIQRILECRALAAIIQLIRGDIAEAERGFAGVEELRGGITDFWVTFLLLLSRPRRLLLAGDVRAALSAAEANHALALTVGETWFVCFSRLEVIYQRLLSDDKKAALDQALAAVDEADSLSCELLRYGSNLALAAASPEHEESSMSRALQIAQAKDYRFIMPYGARLPELDASLWRALGSAHDVRAGVLLESAKRSSGILKDLSRTLNEEAALRAVDLLSGWGNDGRAGLRHLQNASTERARNAARDAYRALEAANPHQLSVRELEVLALLRGGLRTKDIAARLVLTPATVSTHIQRIMAKTGTSSRAELLALATRESGQDVK